MSRHVNWRTPVGWLVKYVIMIHWRSGLRGASLVKKVREHFPDLDVMMGRVVDDKAIVQRGDKGSRIGYENEWPDVNTNGILHEAAAKNIVENDLVLDASSVETAAKNTVVRRVARTSAADRLYVCGAAGSNHCCIGITSMGRASKRVSNFQKGDIEGSLQTLMVFKTDKASELERELKSMFDALHIGNERYSISPRSMIDAARAIVRVRGYSVAEGDE